MSKKKHTDLQPWMEYFEMLQRYREQGLLQMDPERHECYITLTALHAITPGDDPKEQVESGGTTETLRRLRVYSAFLCGKVAEEYLTHSFAMNVVDDSEPHSPKYTMLLTKQKKWWKGKEKIEIVNYEETTV